MAYRRASRSRSTRAYSRPRARSARRSPARRSRRVSGRAQTVRLVIEQAPTGMVARSPAAANFIGMKAAPAPQKAKL